MLFLWIYHIAPIIEQKINKYFSSVYEIGLQHTGWWILLLGTSVLLLELLYGILKYLLQLQMSSDEARPGYYSIGRDVEVTWAVLSGALQQNGGELSNYLHVSWTLLCKKKQLFLLQWACVWRQNICHEKEEAEGLYWLVRQLTELQVRMNSFLEIALIG